MAFRDECKHYKHHLWRPCATSIANALFLSHSLLFIASDLKMHFKLIGLATVWLALSSRLANAHGAHSTNSNPNGDWATWHMQG